VDLKEKIIHESIRLFTRKGFLGTSIQDIQKATNASKGGFYNYFASKEDLFFAVVSQARKIWREKTLYGLDETLSPVEKIQRFLRNYGERYLTDTKHFPGGCLFVTLSVELDDQSPRLRQEIQEGFVRLKGMLRDLLDQGKAAGEIRKDLDTASAAEMIFAGTLGASVLFSMDRSTEALRRSVDALIDYVEGLKA
jgi:AcrR family transcriptional regulator